MDTSYVSHGSNASTDTKGSRNPKTEKDLHHGDIAGFNCSLSRSRQLCRRLTAPDINQRLRIHASSLVVIQPLRSTASWLGLCLHVRQEGTNPEGSRKLDEHRSETDNLGLPGHDVHNRCERTLALLVRRRNLC